MGSINTYDIILLVFSFLEYELSLTSLAVKINTSTVIYERDEHLWKYSLAELLSRNRCNIYKVGYIKWRKQSP